MSTQSKKLIWYVLSACASLALLYVINLILFVVWQSAFTHANVPTLKQWFYLLVVLAITLLGAAVWFFRNAWVIKHSN
jgi:hypothetical protein